MNPSLPELGRLAVVPPRDVGARGAALHAVAAPERRRPFGAARDGAQPRGGGAPNRRLQPRPARQGRADRAGGDRREPAGDDRPHAPGSDPHPRRRQRPDHHRLGGGSLPPRAPVRPGLAQRPHRREHPLLRRRGRRRPDRDSPPAPAFTLVAQPNDWQKTVRAATNQAESLSGKAELYRAFWTRFLDLVRDQRPGGRAPRAGRRTAGSRRRQVRRAPSSTPRSPGAGCPASSSSRIPTPR